MVDNNRFLITCCDDTDGCTPTDLRQLLLDTVPNKREFPLTIYGVKFRTKKQYLKHLLAFLNGN